MHQAHFRAGDPYRVGVRSHSQLSAHNHNCWEATSMTDGAQNKGSERTRRSFLAATSSLAGATLAGGLPGLASAGARHPKRGGTLRFGTREDTIGLDTHRN